MVAAGMENLVIFSWNSGMCQMGRIWRRERCKERGRKAIGVSIPLCLWRKDCKGNRGGGGGPPRPPCVAALAGPVDEAPVHEGVELPQEVVRPDEAVVEALVEEAALGGVAPEHPFGSGGRGGERPYYTLTRSWEAGKWTFSAASEIRKVPRALGKG